MCIAHDDDDDNRANAVQERWDLLKRLLLGLTGWITLIPNNSDQTQSLADFQIYSKTKSFSFQQAIIFLKIQDWFSQRYWYDDESDDDKGDVDHETGVVDESDGAEAATRRQQRVRRLHTWKLADPSKSHGRIFIFSFQYIHGGRELYLQELQMLSKFTLNCLVTLVAMVAYLLVYIAMQCTLVITPVETTMSLPADGHARRGWGVG